MPKFWYGYKGRVHISVQRVQYSGTVPGHEVWLSMSATEEFKIKKAENLGSVRFREVTK